MMAPGIIAELRDGVTASGATSSQDSTRLADGGEQRSAAPEL